MVTGDRGRLEDCPKCGQTIAAGPFTYTIDRQLRDHLSDVHPDAIGRASAQDRDPFIFAYVRPVPGVVEPTWYVVLLHGDAPVLLTKIRPREWRIDWANPKLATKLIERDVIGL